MAAMLEPRGSVALDDYLLDIAWSPDGASLGVIGGEGKVALVSHEASALRAETLGEHMLGALAIAWSPVGSSFVTSGQDGAIEIWNGTDGSRVRTLRPAKSATTQLAYSPDGKRLASAAGRVVSIWRDDGELEHAFEPHASSVAALAWNKPGRDLGAALNGGIAVHRIEPPRWATRFYKWPAAAQTVAFSPNGKMVAAGMQDGAVHFWYLASAKDSQMRGYPGRVNLTAWSGNSRYLATGSGNDIVCWDFGGKGPEGSKPIQLTGHTDRVESLAFQPGGAHLVSGGRDWRLSLWQPGRHTQALDAHLMGAAVSTVRWSPNGRFVAVGEATGRLSVFELQ